MVLERLSLLIVFLIPLLHCANATLRFVPTLVYRPRSVEALHDTRLRSLREAECPLNPLEWDPVTVRGPDTSDLHTLAQLARMSGNAYSIGPPQKNWYDLDEGWNISFPFGWDADDGFRGRVFEAEDNSTIVLAIKGTTLQGPTSKLDKFNDNLLFSCCCARVDITWVFRTVCDCYSSHWRCDDTCLSNALVEDSLFYSIGVNLITDLLALYPRRNIWLVGHSLGGALASLLGATFGLPAVAFESPGERLAAKRLHLPLPPPVPLINDLAPLHKQSTSSSMHAHLAITHVYHTADPIPQGVCTGPLSPCVTAGYALETHCHLGQSILFDTVQLLGWSVDVRKHVLREVVGLLELEDVDWGVDQPDGLQDQGGKGKKKVPRPRIEDDCVDCYKWEFGHFKDKDGKKL